MTSVPGLAAKPIIDMDIVVRSPEEVGAVIERLESVGYRWLGDLGVVGQRRPRTPTRATFAEASPLCGCREQ